MSWKKRRIRKVGTVHDLKKKVWQSIIECERIILESDQKDHAKLQAIHALNSSAKSFLSLEEKTEFEERLTALEKMLNITHHGSNKTYQKN